MVVEVKLQKEGKNTMGNEWGWKMKGDWKRKKEKNGGEDKETDVRNCAFIFA